MENNKDNLEQFNITSLWHKSIYESLMRIEDFLKICRLGGVDVAEALSQPQENLPYIKLKYLDATAIELRNVLDNARAKLDDLFYLKTHIILCNIQEQIDVKQDELIYICVNNITHESNAELTQEFFSCLNDLGKIRSQLILMLKDTLFGEIKEKAEGMDKHKGGDELIR